jgi:hypothetical protein
MEIANFVEQLQQATCSARGGVATTIFFGPRDTNLVIRSNLAEVTFAKT